jgi:hypothetical protein
MVVMNETGAQELRAATVDAIQRSRETIARIMEAHGERDPFETLRATAQKQEARRTARV